VFDISLKQDHFPTYLLSDEGSQTRLEIVPDRGGMVKSWRIQGQDILYLDTESFANPEKSVDGGISILFPICGSLPGNVFLHDGQQYLLNPHGFARELPWELVDREVTTQSVRLSLTLESSDRTRSLYPFDFQLRCDYLLLGDRLRIDQHYRNCGQEPIPFSFGLHSYFWTTDKTQLELDIPAQQQKDQYTRETFPFEGDLDLTREEIDVAFFPLKRHTASWRDRRRQLQVNLSFSRNHSLLVFQTGKGRDYCCLDPWSSPENALNSGEYLLTLPPGEDYHAFVEFDVETLAN